MNSGISEPIQTYSIAAKYSYSSDNSVECDVKGHQIKPLKQYTCSISGSKNHNSRTCPNANPDRVSQQNPIIPGSYVLGSDPFNQSCAQGAIHVDNLA